MITEFKADTSPDKINPLIGIPWLEDGRDHEGADCQGIACLFYRGQGISVTTPKLAESKKITPEELLERIKEKADIIPGNEIQPGDALFFIIKEELHVGIYVGYGRMLQARQNKRSQITRLGSVWNKYFTFALRPKDNEIYIPPSGPVIAGLTAFLGAVIGAQIGLAAGLIGWAALWATIQGAFIGYCIGLAMSPMNLAKNAGSMRYKFGALMNTATNQIPVPRIYGQNRIAGNIFFQTPVIGGEEVDQLICLSEGEVESITDVRINGIKIGDLPDCSYNTFLGTSTQNVESDTGLDLDGCYYRNRAILHVHLKASEKLKGGSPVITCVVEGIKVVLWNGSIWTGAAAYSDNPAACIRDYLLADYEAGGAGIPSCQINAAAFGESYDDCEGTVDGATHALVNKGGGIDTPDTEVPFDGNIFQFPSSGTFKVEDEEIAYSGITKNLLIDEADTDEYSAATADEWKIVKEVAFTKADWMELYTTTFELQGTENGGNRRPEMRLHIKDSDPAHYSTIVGHGTAVEGSCAAKETHTIKFNISDLANDVEATIEYQLKSVQLGDEPYDVYVREIKGWLDNGEFTGCTVTEAHPNNAPIVNITERYKIGFVLDQKRPAIDNLNEMLPICGGMMFRSGATYKMKIQKSEASIATFTEDEIGDFSYGQSDYDQKINRLGIEYFEPDQNDAKILVWGAEDRVDQEVRGMVEKTLTLNALNNRSQALRLSHQYFYELKLNTIICQFTASLDAILLEPGDIIKVTHTLPGWTEKQFRVLEVVETELDTYKITGGEYNASIYNDRYGKGIVIFDYGKPPDPYGPVTDVNTLTIIESAIYIAKDGHVASDIIVAFDQADDGTMQFLHYYVIELRKGSGSFIPYGTCMSADKGFYIRDVEPEETYYVRVKTVSINGVENVGTTSDSLAVVGKTAVPADVTNFAATAVRDHVHFTWTAVADVDLRGYEIRVGASWAAGDVVATNIVGTSYDGFGLTEGAKEYWIKAIDTSDNYSDTAGYTTITIVIAGDVSGISLEEVGWQQTNEGTHIANLDSTWDAPTDTEFLDSYEVWFKKDADDYKFGGTTTDTFFRITNASIGSTYYIKVKTRSIYGTVNTGVVSDPIVIVGKDAVPGNVTTFLVNQFRDRLVFSWLKVDEPDIYGYEIRRGTNWDSGEIVATNIEVDQLIRFDIRIGAAQLYWVKAIDNSGNYSATAKQGSVTIVEIPFTNAIQSYSEAPGWAGDKVNTEKDNGNLIISAGQLTGTYETPERDIGYLATFNIAIEVTTSISQGRKWDSDAGAKFDDSETLRWSGEEAPGAATFEVRTSEDDIDWTDYAAYQRADHYCRYFQIKMTLTRDSEETALLCSKLDYDADLPDVDDFGDDSVTDPATGKAVIFTKTFHQDPVVHVLPTSGSPVYYLLTALSTSGFTVKLYDVAGTSRTGDFDWKAHGI